MWKVNEHMDLILYNTATKLNGRNSPDGMTAVMANNPISYNIGKLFIEAMRSNTDKPTESNIAGGQHIKALLELERIEEF